MTRTRLAWLQYWREVARSALSERIAFLECVSFSLCGFLLSVSLIFESLLAGDNLQGLCPFKAASLPSVGSTRGGASRPHGLKSACSDPAFALVRTYLRRSLTLCSHFRSSASGFAPASGGNASSSRSSSFAGVSTSRSASP